MLKKFSCNMYRSFLHLCVVFLCMKMPLSMKTPLMPNTDKFDKIAFKGRPVPPCIACLNLVKSFLTAVEETTRQSFAGGDADWERKKLGNYENSELRFIEIQEMLCADVELGMHQCYNMAEQHESELEDWFYEKRRNDVNLHEYLCINHLRVCCPNNTYGPNCIPCPGGIEKPCGGHGKCLKGGTREEPASCSCDAGYTGEICNKCDKGYYLDSSILSCTICNEACKGHCRGPGPKDCEVCASGYRFVPDEGCVADFDDDVNKVKIENEPNETDSEPDASKKAMNNQSEEWKLESSVEDASVDGPHAEL